ncbi:Glycoside hydrolase family 18 protein [Mycena chlorophos]|uniref:Glycoside hydrolase family 18 protein n=1 Tax=Mycena chlorophos TaxID=658473 RepID=A0A8H6T403_MYCCL|nr:Glycoside hydrolase family 18 protein [Mycena chlorophos]
MALRLGTLAAFSLTALAFDITRFDNVVAYWGQNSIGAIAGTPPSEYQKPLSYYCNDDSVDVFPIAFVNAFFSTGGLPSLNLANTCNPTDNATFAGTNLPNCQSLASDIEYCQSQGKVVTISLGGANAAVGFSGDSEAVTFAQTIWNLFLGPSSGELLITAADLGTKVDRRLRVPSARLFWMALTSSERVLYFRLSSERSGSIENGGSTGYVAFVNEIRSLASGASKKYYISAAPQCPYPDQNLGSVINGASFDMIYVQFYDNQCDLTNYGTISDWDYGLWDIWATTVSPNPNVKVFIAAPANTAAAGSGYVSLSTLSSILKATRDSFPSFGVSCFLQLLCSSLLKCQLGAALWDISQSEANNDYASGVKSALVAAGGTGFTYPACTAPQWTSSGSYVGGSQVTYEGYIWQAKYYPSGPPTVNFDGDWAAISACGGTSIGTTTSKTTTTTSKTTTTTTSKTTTTTSKTSTTSTTTTSSGSGSCSGAAAWTAASAYPSGSVVSYNGDLWTANQWNEDEVPGGSSGAWVESGTCAGAFKTAAAAAATAAPAKVTVDVRAPSRFFRV